MKNNGIYFPGLNGLRIIAAVLVFLAHLESIKENRGMANLSYVRFFTIGGEAGVTLFFCISGFLITYLLLSEKEKINTIRLKDFYIRRILRIWPLYYLVLFLTLFIIPHFIHTAGFDLEKKITAPGFLLYMALLPYIALALYPINFLAAILWSIGVEETYYLIWPVLIKKVHDLKLNLLLIILAGFIAIQWVVGYYSLLIPGFVVYTKILYHLRLECMIMGGVFAYLLKAKHPALSFFRHPITFGTTCILMLIYHIWGFRLVYDHFTDVTVYIFDPVIYSLLCCVLIINIIFRKIFYSILEWKIFYELGKISYGFYVYHVICLMLAFIVFDRLGLHNTHGWLTGALAFIFTVTLSFISYYGFEQRFLILKKRFTHITSGEGAKEGV